MELEKEVLLPMTIFIKKVLLRTCTGISFVDSTPLRVCRNLMFTPGNVDDREPLKQGKFLENIKGKLCADKGYIGQALFENPFLNGIQLVTKVKNNMKNSLMSIADKILLRKEP